MYQGLYGDIKIFRLLKFVWIKWPITPKNLKRHFDKKNVDRNIQVPALILSTLLLSKTDIGFKRFFRKIGTLFKLCDFKHRGLPYISRSSSPTISHSGLILVLCASQITILSDFIIAD